MGAQLCRHPKWAVGKYPLLAAQLCRHPRRLWMDDTVHALTVLRTTMPKLIDSESRAEVVHEAVCRIVATEGVDAATVRRVADASGLTPAAIRHQWPSQESLHLSMSQWLLKRWRYEEAPRWHSGIDPHQYFRGTVLSLLPLDPGRLLRAQAWLALRRRHLAGDIAEVVHARRRELGAVLNHGVRSLRLALDPQPRPGRAVLAHEYVPPNLDNMDPAAFQLFLLVEGLTALLCDHREPLSAERATAWVNSLDLDALLAAQSLHLDLGA